jgi:hypothetical protein
MTTQHLVFARVFGATQRHVVRAQRHDVHPLRQPEVALARGRQILSRDFSESGLALDQQSTAAGE